MMSGLVEHDINSSENKQSQRFKAILVNWKQYRWIIYKKSSRMPEDNLVKVLRYVPSF